MVSVSGWTPGREMAGTKAIAVGPSSTLPLDFPWETRFPLDAGKPHAGERPAEGHASPWM